MNVCNFRQNNEKGWGGNRLIVTGLTGKISSITHYLYIVVTDIHVLVSKEVLNI